MVVHRHRRVHLLHHPNLTTRLHPQSARIPRSVRSRQCSASLSHGAHSNTTNFPSPHRPEIPYTTKQYHRHLGRCLPTHSSRHNNCSN